MRLVGIKVRVLPASGAQMMCSFVRIALISQFSSRSPSLWEAKLGVPSWPCRACPRWRPWGAAYRWACHAVLGPTSVVVLPSGTPMRCLREDMAIASVLEVWAMVPRGLPHHHHRRVGGQGGPRGSKIESPRKWSRLLLLHLPGPYSDSTPPLMVLLPWGALWATFRKSDF